jgi:arylamine N-acetyltransferase
MAEPDVHAVNVVTADGGEFLVDVGYGAPLRAPLPLDSAAPVSVSLGPERWELHPRDASGRSRLDHRRDGVVVHGYTVDPRPRRSEHFAAVIARSFRSDALFLNCLRILRHGPERSVSVRDREVTVITGGTVRATTLPSREALRDVVAVLLQIPEAVTDAALDALEERASERQ